MENKYYIYAHTIATHGGDRPFGQIFYIGRGCRKRAYSKQDRIKHWHNIVNKYDYNVHFFETDLTNDEANLAEIRYIKAIGREDLGLGSLINLSDGGGGISGYVCSEETRKKLSKASKGRIHSEETRKKISQANKDKPKSEEHKNKLSKFRTGLKASNETKEKMSKAHIGNKSNTGRKLSESHCKNIGKGQLGHKHNLGKIHTEEHNKKISESNKLRWMLRKQEQK